MFRKYEKTFRILVPQINVPGKLILSKNEAGALLSGRVTIEEKMDGANVGIIRHKQGFSLQKRGSLVGVSEHEQFQFFHGWANQIKYEQIMSLPVGTLIYGELLFAKHTVFYNRLPDYFLAFDVFNVEHGWMPATDRDLFCKAHGFAQVPFVAEGIFQKAELADLIPSISNYGSEPAEGIVIKRYKKDGTKLQAKLVRPEFIKRMEENDHWMHQAVTRNELA